MKYLLLIIILGLFSCENSKYVVPVYNSIRGTWTFTSNDISSTFTIGNLPDCNKLAVVSGTVQLGSIKYDVVPFSADICQSFTGLDSITTTSIYLGNNGYGSENIKVRIQSVSPDFKTMISDKIYLDYSPGYVGTRDAVVTLIHK